MQSRELEQQVLATLAYYGALRWPLTVVELSRRLIALGGDEARIGQLTVILEQLVADGRIRGDAGLYVLGDAPLYIVENRVRREAESATKWRMLLRWAWWLQAVPFVRMMAASGSLAMGATSTQSDWDMFVIVQAGRLYTARLGLLMVAKILGRLRTKRMRSAPNRFCFNHIITTDGLAVRHRSIFTAHALAWLVPFYDPWRYTSRLRDANQWVYEYSSSSIGEQFTRRNISPSRFLSVMRRSIELILVSPIGTLIERGIRAWMQRRIACNPETTALVGRIVADNRELEFHPRSFEAIALARYNATLQNIGLGIYIQRDSGLRH